ncbi:hypothetical protein AW27_007655 [Streptomyces sp. PCS3-D2]|uniref:hypothetical protein n=1 Tax=Streptomyces sp. PCS3-D2 TaxID=1460244 RepID=UPI0005669420|nr:hypothetical protein [Streptomyces sp. PCS3-D2]WKV71414.1 hypothetical protein AW27_007655 [Streptomyces sp. PCS3-D2]
MPYAERPVAQARCAECREPRDQLRLPQARCKEDDLLGRKGLVRDAQRAPPRREQDLSLSGACCGRDLVDSELDW